ncbi:FkbM family methyltransferase [Candidatus Uabimicrobium amorphum]|uniref:Methyltransferase FkbM domain-containing protein n=1 Tax=Uabimicrobium amorphum TaxID=2596890 RepID=A0A5S9IMI2_UABAM|nr:FkbM family methyltransferase [Candidatus Uabimicrobium amorphum]BBM83780.1 hypothetical protein UABAM_02135 [Candidatus Uabimicrobium amorphum]
MLRTKQLQKFIPKKWRPLIKKIYVKWHNPLSQKEYNELPALKCTIAYNKYGGYCVPESSQHRPAAQKILFRDVYEPKTIEYLIANCGNGDIVHAGTYFGDFLPALAKNAAQGATIWAFEPNIENYECANVTVLINRLHNVVLHNAGLGCEDKNSYVVTSSPSGKALGGLSKIVDNDSPGQKQTVQLMTIDNIISTERNVSVIQLDVEGYEEYALKGGIATIRRCLPIIIVETSPTSELITGEWFRTNILGLGYKQQQKIHGNIVFIPATKR